MKLITILILSVTAFTAQAGEIEYRKPRPGDKGSYVLIEMQKEGNIAKALHKRVGPSGTGFTRTESNCATGQMRDIAYGEGSVKDIKVYPANMQYWYNLVNGSSKSDLFKFVCLK